MEVQKIKNYVNGEWVESATDKYLEIRDSATDELIALCPDSTDEEVEQAVRAAREAFPAWRSIIPTRRAEFLYAIREKIIKAKDELARIIVKEHGKTYTDAAGELMRAIQYIEHPCGIPELLKGSFSDDVGTGVDEYYVREPLGVFVVIPPFNFPAMISLYFTWPIACGNTVIIKPSEICPMTITRIMELIEETGLPKGVLNLINGGPSVGNKLITHPDVMGVTFVGSSKVAEIVYKTATSLGKRAQCQGGAKNHAVVMADGANEETLANLVNSCFGHTGQRCFAISNILIEESIYDRFLEKFISSVKALKLGHGMDEGVTMGPVVSKQALENLHKAVDKAVSDGAKIILDGRNIEVKEYPNGYFMGPTILEAEPYMDIFKEEVFGPVRCVKKIKDLSEAIEIVNLSPYGHTAVLYTDSGSYAKKFMREVNTGQVGINVGTPAPIAFYPVGGRKISFYGDLRGRANDAIDFYTDKKVVVTRWKGSHKAIW